MLKLLATLLAWITARSSEKTTVAGVVALGTAIGIASGKPEVVEAINQVAGASPDSGVAMVTAHVLAAAGGLLIGHEERRHDEPS